MVARETNSRDLSDEVLVVSAMLGDLDAFGQLVSRYRAAVVRVAARIAGPDSAEDIAQESLLLAFKALPSIEEPSRFAGWLNAITRNRALRFSTTEQARRRKVVEFDQVLLDEIPSLSRPPDQSAIESVEIVAALDALPDDLALMLRLRYLDEMPLKRIAAFLGKPLSTVKWRLHRARKLLRDRARESETGGSIWNAKRK